MEAAAVSFANMTFAVKCWALCFPAGNDCPVGPNGAPAYTCSIDHASSFTLPVISLVVITILNDGTIITIAYDKVIPEVRPQKWDLREVRAVQTLAVLRSC